MSGNIGDTHGTPDHTDSDEQPDTTDEQGRPVDNPSGG